MDNMLNRLDKTLTDLIDIAEDVVAEAKEKKYFDRDFAEAIGIILSLAYGRWGSKK